MFQTYMTFLFTLAVIYDENISSKLTGSNVCTYIYS